MHTIQWKTEGVYRGRFAPSPTGPLHLGSMFTALASFLQARSRQGEWLLRIDDIDTPRVMEGATGAIKRTLEDHALFWDGDIVMQSRKSHEYHSALRMLDASGILYPCNCSRQTLRTMVSRSGKPSPYPGTCRMARISRRQAHALRVMTRGASITVDDELQGSRCFDIEREFGDFVVLRRDGIISYHLATVIDDWQAGVTEVLRGFDLLESTPLQMHLQKLLGLPSHTYSHVPIVADRLGIKLSKQNLAEAVDGKNASATLFLLLDLLKQSPPLALKGALPDEILAWAVPNWDISKLSGVSVLAVGGRTLASPD